MIVLSSYRAYRAFPLLCLLFLTSLRLSVSTAWAQKSVPQAASAPAQIAHELETIHLAEQQHRPEAERGALWAHLALDYHSIADFQKAEDAYNHALHLLKHEPLAEAEYAETLEDLGVLYLIYGRLNEAERVRKQALAARKKLGDLAEVGVSEVHLADIAFERHQYKKAEQLALLGIKEMNSSPKPPRAGTVSGLITVTYARCLRGHCDQGLPSAQQAVSFARSHFPPGSAAIGFAMETLGYAEWKNGAMQDGEKDLLDGIRILRSTLVPTDPRLGGALLQYGDYLNATSRRAEAQGIHEEVERINNQAGVCAACTVSVYSLSKTLR